MKIRRAADRHVGGVIDDLQHHLGRLTGRELRLLRHHFGLESVQLFIDLGRDVPAQHPLEVAAFALRQALQAIFPGRVNALATLSRCSPCGADLIRNDERRIRPVKLHARSRNLILPERGTVRFLGTLLGGRAKTDDGFAGDHCRLVAWLA